MSEFWRSVIELIGGQVALLAVLAFLGRTLITHWFKAGLSKFNIEAQHIADRTLAERKIRYSNIVEQQASAIHEFYKLLIEFDRAADSALDASTNQEYGERFKAMIDSFSAVENYFINNEILFPETVCRLYNDISRIKFLGSRNAASYYRQLQRLDSQEHDSRRLELIEELKEEKDQLARVPVLLETLKEEFRKLIGIIT